MQYKTGLTSAAVLAAAVSAQTKSSSVPSSCSIPSGATATSQADLDKYSDCKKLVGNLLVSGDIGSASLANVEKIDGSLEVSVAPYLKSFAADSLEEVSEGLVLAKLTTLETASFGSLEKVSSINFTTLPAASRITTSKLRSARNIVISDTSLASIQEFSSLESVETFDVNNNRDLTSISSSLKTVGERLSVTFNGKQANVSFNNLIWANNITLKDITAASFKSLGSVNASLEMTNNSLSDISFPSLKKVGSAISIRSNPQLNRVDFPNLTAVGGALSLADNSELKQINGFSNVQTIGGALVVGGNFNVLNLDSLKTVKGGADVETTASNYSCDSLQSLQSSGGIQGDNFVCKSGSIPSGSAAGSDSGSSPSTAKTDSKSGAAAHFGGPGPSFLGAVAAVAFALL